MRNDDTILTTQMFKEDLERHQEEYNPAFDLENMVWFTNSVEPNPNTDITKKRAFYHGVTGEYLLLHHPIDISGSRNNLVSEFPWLKNIIDDMLMPTFMRMSSGRTGLVIDPTIFVGGPGVGKSQFARRFFEELSMPYRLIGVGGANNDQLFGVPIGFATGHASILLEEVNKYRHANPAIIMDEIEKVTQDVKNGNILHRLLSLLEKSEAKAWHETFLMQPCDFSYVNWLFTANSLEPLPDYFRSRCKIYHIPAPPVEYFGHLVSSIRKQIIRDQSMHPLFYRGFCEDELRILKDSYMEHQSIRILVRQVKKLMFMSQEMKMQ